MKTKARASVIAAILISAVTILPSAKAGEQEQCSQSEGFVNGPKPNPSGIDVSDNKNITIAKIYPTVSNGEFTLELKSKSCEDVNVTVTDITGRVVMSETISGFGGEIIKKIVLTEPGCGTYIIKVIQGKEVWYDRLVNYSTC